MAVNKQQQSILFCIITVSLMIAIIPIEVHASTIYNTALIILPGDPFYGLKITMEEIRQSFTWDKTAKAQIIGERIDERQKEVQALAKQNREIPKDFDRQTTKLVDELKDISNTINTTTDEPAQDESGNVVLDAINAGIQKAKDTGEVVVALSYIDQFNDIRKISNLDEQRIQAVQLDTKINDLNIVKKNCEQKIITLDVINSNSTYLESIEKVCSGVRNVPDGMIKSIIAERIN